jgi:hypothetical protein
MVISTAVELPPTASQLILQARLLLDSELRHVTQTVGSGITNVIEVDERLDLFVQFAQPGSTL